MGEAFMFEVEDGSFACHVERPASLPAPVVILLPEIFGVNDDLKQSCRELAERGYIAVCPELFWRFEPGFALNHWTGEAFDRAVEYYGRFDRDRAAADIARLVAFARTLPDGTGKVGLMGFCLGGLMTFLVSARSGADASVCYYPGSVQDYLDEAAGIANPMIIHLAGEDVFVPRDAQAAVHAAVDPLPNITVYDYATCDHAFARHGGTEYNEVAATMANGRSWMFLKAELG